MVPRSYDADESAVFSTAEGIKNKVQQLHRRLQLCVENLETISGSAGGCQRNLQSSSSTRQQIHAQSINESLFLSGLDARQTGPTYGVFVHDSAIPEARRTSDASALPGDALIQHDSEISSRLLANGISVPNSWGGTASGDVEWEDTLAEAELNEGLGMGLDDFEQLHISGVPSHRARYGTVGDEPPVTAAPPAAASVSSALQALKRSLSPRVRSSLRGGQVPKQGEQLRTQYQKAVGDTVQKRLVGRADVFQASGSLLKVESSGADGSDGRSMGFSLGHPAAGEAGSSAVSPGVASPRRSAAVGSTSHTVLRANQETGKQRQFFNKPSIQLPGGGELAQAEEGMVSPGSPHHDMDNQRTATVRSRIPPPPAVSRFAGEDKSKGTPGPLQTDLSPASSAGTAPVDVSAGDQERPGHSAADRRALVEDVVAFASPRAGLHVQPDPAALRRQLSKSKDRFPSTGSTGSGGLGWKFSSAESGGVMLIGVGSGGIGGGEDRVDCRMSPTEQSLSNSPRPFAEPDEGARHGAQSSRGEAPAIGFVPPLGLPSGAVPSGNQAHVLGFVPPTGWGNAVASPHVPSTSSVGFRPSPDIMSQSTAATSAAASSTPSVGFIPLGLLAADRSHSNSASSGGGAARMNASPAAGGHSHPAAEPSAQLGTFHCERMQDQPAAPSAVCAVEIMPQCADALTPSCSAQSLAARIPVGDFSFGINTKVFASSSRLKIRISGDSRSGAGLTQGLQKVDEENAEMSESVDHAEKQLAEVPSQGSSTASARWPGTSSDGASASSTGPAAAAPLTTATGATSLDGMGGSRASVHMDGLHRWYRSVSGGPSSNDAIHVEQTGKLPWEESSDEEEAGSPATREMAAERHMQTAASGAVLNKDDAPGSPFASAVTAAHAAPAAPQRAMAAPAVEQLPLAGTVYSHQLQPVSLSPLQQKAADLCSPDSEQESPLAASGISTAMSRAEEVNGMNLTTCSASAAPAEPHGAVPEGPTMPATAPLRPRLATSDASSHVAGVSITITDADIARTGGMVPALLEIVRERFRQKGFHNLAHLAAAGVGASAAVEAASTPTSPALAGETLAERIVARVETFQTRKSEELAIALRPSLDLGSEGQAYARRGTVGMLAAGWFDHEPGLSDHPIEDAATLERYSIKQRTNGCSSEIVTGRRLHQSVSGAIPHAITAARPSSGGVSAPVVPTGTTRFVAPTIAISGIRQNGDGSRMPRSPPSNASASMVGGPQRVAPASPSSQLATAFGRGSLALQQAITSSSLAKPCVSTTSQSQLPGAPGPPPAGAPTPPQLASLFVPAGEHASTLPTDGSNQKAEQGTQTGMLPLEPEAAPDSLSGLPLGTAQEYFLSTTVPLSGQRTSTRGGAYDNDADKLLTPESPNICTAADFFRGAASRATTNNSTMGPPHRPLPGTSSTSPFATVAAAALVTGTLSRGGSSGGRTRSARESTMYSQAGPASRPRLQSASGRLSVSTGGVLGRGLGHMSSSSGRVMIDEEPVDMEALSSSRTTYAYPSRRPSAAAVAWGPGHTARVAFEDDRDSAAVSDGAGRRRALTREMLMRLARLGRESRHAFDTTTDEEHQRQEASWRARQNRSSTGQRSPRRRATVEDGGAADAHVGRRHGHGHQHGHLGSSAGASSGAVATGSRTHGSMTRQLAIVAGADAGGTCNSSPATAAAPGDLISLPPLSLDAPDMPEPCGGDTPACAVISPVARSRATGGSSLAAGSGSLSQLPHETVFIPPVNGWAQGRSRPEEPTCASFESSTAAPASASRGVVQSAGGNALEGAGPAARPRAGRQQGPRFSRGMIATEGGSHHRQPQRVYTPGTTNTTTSWSDSSGGDADDIEGDSVAGEEDGLTQRRGQQQVRSLYPHSRAASNKGGARAVGPRGKHGAGSTSTGQGASAAARGSFARHGMSVDWDSEGGLPSVPFDSFEVDIEGAETLDRDPSPLSLSRGAVSPSSAAASMLSQGRYVAAARAHRSVSEANSIKRLSSGALQPDDGDVLGVVDVANLGGGGQVAVAAADGSGGGGRDSSGRRVVTCRHHTRISSDRDGDGEVGIGLFCQDRREPSGRRSVKGGDVEAKPQAKRDLAAGSKDLSVPATHGLRQEGFGDLRLNVRSSQAEPASTSPKPSGSRIRQSLQRLLDIRSSAASSRQAQSASSVDSEQSAGAVPTPRRPPAAKVFPIHLGTNRRSAVAMKGAKVGRDRDHPSPSPSVTATAGGTTEADAAERDAPLRSAGDGLDMDTRGGDTASTPRWRQARPAPLEQQRRRRSSGSEASGADVPPEDPLALVSPNYTQDMAEEEYGWDVATGDADVDNLTSPRGRRTHTISTSGGAPARRLHKPPPPPLPYDPAEVPSASIDDACPNFTRELEQQEMLDAVSELLGSLSLAASESSPGGAEQEPSFSLEPRARTGAGTPSASASRRSSPSLISGSWRGSPPSGSSPREVIRRFAVEGSPQHALATPRSTTAGDAVSSSPTESRSGKASPSPGAEEAPHGMGGPSWLSALLTSPQLAPHKATAGAVVVAAAAAAQPHSDGGSTDDSHAPAKAVASQSPKHSSARDMRTALADLLAAMQPLASRSAAAAAIRPDLLTTNRMNVEEAPAANTLKSVATAAAAAPIAHALHPMRQSVGQPRERASAVVEDDLMASGRSSASSNPDPELRRLLLTAWSRWYLRKSLGPYAGNQAEAAAAAAAAQARLQSLAAAHSRAGSEAWDGVSPSVDLTEAANDSRLHTAFIRWLGHARSARRSTPASGRRWAEPRSARSWNSMLTSSGPTNIAPPYPTSLAGLPSHPAALTSARVPSSPLSARPAEPAWSTAALRTASSQPSQPIGSQYGMTGLGSRPVQQYIGAGTVAVPSSPRTAVAMTTTSYGGASTRPVVSSVIATPTISRTSGVCQVLSQQQQQQQRQQLQRQQLQPPHPNNAVHPSPRQQLLQQQQPPFVQSAPPQHIATRLTGSSIPQYQRPSTPRSLLEQHITAAVPITAAAVGTVPLSSPHASIAASTGRQGSAATAAYSSHADPIAADTPRDLESLIALRLLDGLSSGSDGVILAGLQLATGGAFESDRTSVRAPSPRIGSGTGDSAGPSTNGVGIASGSLPAATAAAQGAAGSAWMRLSSTGRFGSSSSSQHTVMYGGSLLGPGAASSGSILERPLLTAQQPYSPGTGPVSGSSRARTTASPRLGAASGGGSSSAGGTLARGSASPRPTSPRPGLSGVGLVGYSGMEAMGVGGLLGNGSLPWAPAPPSPRLGASSGGGNRFDLLRAVPPSPRPTSAVSSSAGLASSCAPQPGLTLSHGGLLRPGPMGAARMQAPYPSPRSSLRPGNQASNDNIRAISESGPDQLNLAYYGLRL